MNGFLSQLAPGVLAVVTGGAAAEGPDMAELMKHLVLQLAVIIICARLSGFVFKKFFQLPSVIGELIAGMVIGPYAFGRLSIPGVGVLFPLPHGMMPVSPELYGIATIASILLLFLSGLETDLATFIRFSGVGTAVGLGGVIFSFAFGDLCAIWFGLADSFMSPTALFLGTISTATSVGITARILSEKHKTDSPEGVTILAGAVLDDVLGIVVLAIVVGMAKVSENHGAINWGHIAAVATKAIGFWIICTVIGLFSARRITRVLKYLQSPELIASISLGIALVLAGFMETAGLAMIIGAYITGLSLSRTDLVHVIHDQLHGTYNLLVPVFFCVMGMLVDFSALKGMLLFGIVYSVLAILAKVIGCGLPALMMKFNLRGAYRIGAGMVPRGEVALIVAGIGLSSGVIPANIFGVSIMMTMITTLLAPPLLVRAFEGKSGLKASVQVGKGEEVRRISLEFPSADLAEFMLSRITRAFRNEEFFVTNLSLDTPTYQVRKDKMVFTLTAEGSHLELSSPEQYEHVARFIALEELLVLQDLVESCRNIKSLGNLQTELVTGLFDDAD